MDHIDPNEKPPAEGSSGSATPPNNEQVADGNVKYESIHPATSNRRSSRALSRRASNASSKEQRDPNMDINLPYRTLSGDANLSEYITESRSGQIPGPVEPDGRSHYKLVTFLPNDPENPKNWSKAYKWYCTMVVAITCFVVAFASSVVTADIIGVADEFHVSEEVALLTVSLFVVGFGVGESISSENKNANEERG